MRKCLKQHLGMGYQTSNREFENIFKRCVRAVCRRCADLELAHMQDYGELPPSLAQFAKDWFGDVNAVAVIGRPAKNPGGNSCRTRDRGMDIFLSSMRKELHFLGLLRQLYGRRRLYASFFLK